MKPLPIGLTNAERPAGDKPPERHSSPTPVSEHWHGSAAGQVIYWRNRALKAEARVSGLEDTIRMRRAEDRCSTSCGRDTEAAKVLEDIETRRGSDWKGLDP